MIRAALRRLRADTHGAAMIEFAIVAPVMILLIMGLSELAYESYVQAILTGAMQKAGRDSTIQGNASNSATIDGAVMTMVRAVASSSTYVSSRKSYAQFGNIAPEPYQDNNNNGQYDQASECFTDLNGNGVWDADPGASGQGLANDVVVYKMVVTYPRPFPLMGMLGWAATQTATSTTILKNQPYALQSTATPTQICPPSH